MSDPAEIPPTTVASAIQRLNATAEAIQAAVDRLHRSAGLALAKAQGEGRVTPEPSPPCPVDDPKCHLGNTLATPVDGDKQPKWYVVPVGRNPGVFCGSEDVARNVNKIPGAYTERYDSEEKARSVFRKALLDGIVEKVVVIVNRSYLTLDDFPDM